MLSLSRNEAVPLKTMRAGMPWDWETFPEYPRQRRTHAEGRERAGAGAVGAALPVRGRRRPGQSAARHRRASWTRCASSLFEAMEAGGCGWSSQITGDRGNVQRDYDGTPMVTDEMTEREIVAFSRVLRRIGRGTTQITGPLETAALIARESGRPIIWNALAPTGSREPARRVAVPAPRDHRPARRAEPAGRCAGARVGADRAVQVRDRARGLQPHGHLPRVAGSSARHVGGEDREVQRSGAPAGAEGSHRHDGRRLRRRRGIRWPTSR